LRVVILCLILIILLALLILVIGYALYEALYLLIIVPRRFVILQLLTLEVMI